MQPDKAEWVQTLEEAEKITTPEMIEQLNGLLIELDCGYTAKLLITIWKYAVDEDAPVIAGIEETGQFQLLTLLEFLLNMRVHQTQEPVDPAEAERIKAVMLSMDNLPETKA